MIPEKPEQPPTLQRLARPVVNPEKYFPYLITVVFFILSFIGILHHHPWRDEFQAWMVARDAHSLSELGYNLRHDGHPALYYLFLYVISSLSHNPFWMQLFCIYVSTVIVFLINFYSPFPITVKIFISFGYYVFFEYSLVARGYGLEFLFVVICCILYKYRYKDYYALAVALFLLASTESYGMLLSLSFSGILFLDYLLNRKLPEVSKIPLTCIFICGGLIITGCVLSALQVQPEPDNTFGMYYPGKVPDWDRLKTVFFEIVNAYYALPNLADPHYWNTNFFGACSISNGVTTPGVNSLWPALTFLIFSIYFIRKPLLLLLYMVGTLGLLYFYYYTFLLAQRYIGHLFILLFAAMWLDHFYDDKVYKNKILAWLSLAGKEAGSYLFMAILAINFFGGIGSYYKDFTTPFSTSYQVVDYLRENKLDKLEMAGSMDCLIEPIAGMLDRKIYYFESNREGSFIYYNKERNSGFRPQDLMNYLHNRLAQSTRKIVLIMSFQLKVSDTPSGALVPLVDYVFAPGIHIQLVQSINSGVVDEEKYFIYLVDQKK